jgi:branched-chain amino acid transport system substrate-binding protein
VRREFPRVDRWNGRRTAYIAIACLGCVLFSGCPHGTAADTPIVLGLIAYQGIPFGSSTGSAVVQAAQLAADEVNRAGGIELHGSRRAIKLAVEQCAPTPEAALASAERLINQENVAAIVGPHWSREALPVADVAERAHVPLIATGSTHPKLTEGRKYIFRIPFTDALQGQVLATFARDDLNARRAALLYDASDPYMTNLAVIFSRVFEQRGGQVVATETYTPDANTNFSTQLHRIRRQKPDVLLLPNLTEDAIAQARQARALGITATLLGTDMWRTDGVTSDLDGAYFTKPTAFDEERYAALSAAFDKAFKSKPGTEAVETYDAFGLLFAAIRFRGDAAPDAIRQGLYDMGPYPGVTGPIDYVTDGSPARNLAVLEVRDNHAVPRRTLPEGTRP